MRRRLTLELTRAFQLLSPLPSHSFLAAETPATNVHGVARSVLVQNPGATKLDQVAGGATLELSNKFSSASTPSFGRAAVAATTTEIELPAQTTDTLAQAPIPPKVPSAFREKIHAKLVARLAPEGSGIRLSDAIQQIHAEANRDKGRRNPNKPKQVQLP